MTVGNETQRVGPGDSIFIPSGRPHGLENDGDVTLRYFSAAASAYDPGHLGTDIQPLRQRPGGEMGEGQMTTAYSHCRIGFRQADTAESVGEMFGQMFAIERLHAGTAPPAPA